jgi:hypothetical protein
MSKLIARHPMALALAGAIALFAVTVVLAFAAGNWPATSVGHAANGRPDVVASHRPHFRNL